MQVVAHGGLGQAEQGRQLPRGRPPAQSTEQEAHRRSLTGSAKALRRIASAIASSSDRPAESSSGGQQMGWVSRRIGSVLGTGPMMPPIRHMSKHSAELLVQVGLPSRALAGFTSVCLVVAVAAGEAPSAGLCFNTY